MTPDIKLTPEELEELKDDIKWRTKTTIYLKQLSEDFKDHCNVSLIFRKDVEILKAHRTMQWFFIGAICIAVILGRLIL